MQVVYEDNHLIVVSKRSGEIVQGDKTGDKPLSETVKDYIKEKYQKPGAVFLGVTHRLDRPVSGLVIFARTSKALERKFFIILKLKSSIWISKIFYVIFEAIKNHFLIFCEKTDSMPLFWVYDIQYLRSRIITYIKIKSLHKISPFLIVYIYYKINFLNFQISY